MLRTIIIIIAVIALGAGGYFAYQKFTTSSQDVVTNSVINPDELPGAEIVVELSRLPTSLDGSIFTDASYLKLADGSINLNPMPSGKSNPFAPIISVRTNKAR